MTQNAKLYINGRLIEFQDAFHIAMNYKVEDISNPTNINNSYSKTIVVEGTKANNVTFGNLWNVNRSDNGKMNYDFDPLKKNPFELFLNGEKVQDGYCKLDNIVSTENRIEYHLTLYGGLGNFFYNLAYNEKGERRKLSDIDYGGGDGEMDINVTAQNIYDAWDYLRIIDQFEDTNNEFDLINFMTAYNGEVPNEFDAQTALLRVKDVHFPEPVPNSNSDENGYFVAKFNKSYTVDETRDYRAYLQRPVLRMKRLIRALCEPENNGGYKVNLDSKFFNNENPYYQHCWLTLPTVNELPKKVAENKVYTLTIPDTISNNGTIKIPVTVDRLQVPSRGSVKIPIKLQAIYYGDDYKYLSTDWMRWEQNPSVRRHYYSSYYIQLYVRRADGTYNNASNVYNIHSLKRSEEWMSFTPEIPMPEVELIGNFNFEGDGEYVFEKPIILEIPNLYIENGGGLEIHITRKWVDKGGDGNYLPNAMYRPSDAGSYPDDPIHNLQVNAPVHLKEGTDGEGNSGEYIHIKEYENFITKKRILNTEATPLDYLLSFTKQFGLYFVKKEKEKTIDIMLRDNFYTGEVMNISNDIDYSRPYTIYPLSFDNKWIDFKLPIEECTLSKTYNAVNSPEFGVQRVDTNYVYNDKAKNLLDKNIYKNAIMQRKYSRYNINSNTLNIDGRLNECFPIDYIDACTYYNINSYGNIEEKWPDGLQRGSYGLTEEEINDSSQKLYDALYDKMVLCDFENDGSPINGANVLVFFDRLVVPNDENGNQYYAKLSDDIPEMQKYVGHPCWLFDNANTIQIRWMPQFSRYYTWDNLIHQSFNMGKPAETYTYDLVHSTDSNIYNKYWKNFINDQYLKNTRIVECYVNWNNTFKENYLRKLFFFDGCYWTLIEVQNYDLTTNVPTKCKFIKVNDISNYSTE